MRNDNKDFVAASVDLARCTVPVTAKIATEVAKRSFRAYASMINLASAGMIREGTVYAALSSLYQAHLKNMTKAL